MRTNWDEPPGPGDDAARYAAFVEEHGLAGARALGAGRPPVELRLCESAPIPEVNVYLSGPLEEATLRIVVVQEHPGRLVRLVIGCATALLVTAAALWIAEIWAGG